MRWPFKLRKLSLVYLWKIFSWQIFMWLSWPPFSTTVDVLEGVCCCICSVKLTQPLLCDHQCLCDRVVCCWCVPWTFYLVRRAPLVGTLLLRACTTATHRQQPCPSSRHNWATWPSQLPLPVDTPLVLMERPRSTTSSVPHSLPSNTLPGHWPGQHTSTRCVSVCVCT